NGSSLNHQETQIVASNTLTLESGRDTLIQGAQLKGDSIVADVGRDLRIESLQDASKFDSKESSGGFNASICVPPFCFGSTVSGSVSASAGKINSNYQSVVEQSGLYAGKGGFDIDVGRHTELTGGVIASAAEADKNRLSTDTLGFRDLQNQAEYKAGSLGVTVSGSSGNLNQGAPVDSGVQDFADQWNKAPADPRKDPGSQTGANPNIGLPSSDSASGTTASAIGAGTIEVRSDQGTGQDSTAGLSRDTAAANGAIDQIFDEKAVRAQQELSRLTGEVGFKLVGDLASSQKADAEKRLAEAKASGNQDAINAAQADVNAWSDGGSYKVMMHGLTGFLQAKLGGGNVSASTLAALGNEAMLPYLADYLKSQGLKEGSSEFNSLLKLGSAAVGSAIGQAVGGGQAGAATAVAATTNNYLNHTQAKLLLSELRNCAAKKCGNTEYQAILARYEAMSIANSNAMMACTSRACVESHLAEIAQYDKAGDPTLTGLNEFGPLKNVGYDVMGLAKGNPGYVTRPSMNPAQKLGGKLFILETDLAFAKYLANGWLTKEEKGALDQWNKRTDWIDKAAAESGHKLTYEQKGQLIAQLYVDGGFTSSAAVQNGVKDLAGKLSGLNIKPVGGSKPSTPTKPVNTAKPVKPTKPETTKPESTNPETTKPATGGKPGDTGSLVGRKVEPTTVELNPVTGVYEPVKPGTSVVVAKPISPTVVGAGGTSSAGQPATGTSLVTTSPGTSLVVVNGNGMLKPSTGAGLGGSAATGDVLLLGLGP
ncbi:MAG: hemagglutinin repeat-containing protein, partial [Chitinimonas sp.]|nr:hemagglutinin repeat-containing protein [Chitinimonas sp.]